MNSKNNGNLFQIAILTFCIQQSFGQEDVRFGEFGKSSRSLSGVQTAAGWNNNVESNFYKVALIDSPDEFIIKKPETRDKVYNDFLSFLYRGDKVKPRVKREIINAETSNDGLARGKRMLVFRCLSRIV